MSPKPQQSLKIHPAPFAPSKLSIPPSPFSPLSPLDPIHNRPTVRSYAAYSIRSSTDWPHPPSPLHWVWTCHQCSHSYGLGVTRKCLDDGHTFCSGTTTVKTWKGRNSKNPRSGSKAKRHRACGSEFDYQGWKTWGRWRRSGRKDSIYDTDMSDLPASYGSCSSSDDSPTTASTNDKTKKDCWRNCDYPSECRWGKRFGIHTPVTDSFPIGINNSSAVKLHRISPPPSPEGVLRVENIHATSKKPESLKTDFWGALLASATRRRSHTPSPLASVSGAPEPRHPTTVSPQALLRDHDGDLYMTMPTLESSVTRMKGMIKKKSKRVKRSRQSEEQHEMRKLDPEFQVASPLVVEGESIDLDRKGSDKGRDEFGFARLERVRSRDSGYHSFGGSSA